VVDIDLLLFSVHAGHKCHFLVKGKEEKQVRGALYAKSTDPIIDLESIGEGGTSNGTTRSKTRSSGLALALRNKGKSILGVLAVESTQLAIVAKGLGLSRWELGTNGLVNCSAGVCADGGGRASTIGHQRECVAGVLAVVEIQQAGVVEGLVLAVLGDCADGILDHKAHKVAHGGLTGRIGKDDKLGVGVLAAVILELALVSKSLCLAIDGLGTNGLVDSGADIAALGNSGGGHGREDNHQGGDGQGNQGVELHCWRELDRF
jgi:hypothetical protein